jgi:hypothetical protein
MPARLSVPPRYTPPPRPTGPPPGPPLLLRTGTSYRLDTPTGPLVRLLDVSACGQFARVENRARRFRHETRAARLVAATDYC